jgi:hypothetical protein
MRSAWSILVLLVVGAVLFNSCSRTLGAESAVQASQLYNEASMYILGVIAITLGAWYSDGALKQKQVRRCPYCAEDIKREASVCRYCGCDVEPIADSGQGAGRNGNLSTGATLSGSDFNDLLEQVRPEAPPGTAKDYYGEGMKCLQRHNTEDARLAFARAICVSSPGSKWHEAALRRLQELTNR